MAYRTIGNTVFQWEDNTPLIFTMTELTGPADHRTTTSVTIDLSVLQEGFEDAFLVHLKEHLIEQRNRNALRTVEANAKMLKRLFTKVTQMALFNTKVGVIDEALLLRLASVKEDLSAGDLRIALRTFKANPASPLFAAGLQANDFPAWKPKKGRYGSQIDRILAKSLSQAAIAHILDLCDTAYATGKIDIGHYSFAHLAFAVFCRPNSYRQIRVSDLIYDKKSNQYFIQIITSKSGEHIPGKVNFCINEPLGVLLTKQRQHVIATYGHLVAKDDMGKLALFPARRLEMNNSRWIHEYANQAFGMCKESDTFCRSYPFAIKRKLKADPFTLSANALRHTVGTLLAQTGASANTVQAVLKHASVDACQAYVDIAFHGMIHGLSDAMRPAFIDHLPGMFNFRTKGDPVPAEKLIRSENLESGQIEETGECGKQIACERAPIVCYGCFRFRPCWDADHSITLAMAQREIDEMSEWGKPFHHMLEKAKTAKNQIIIIMNAADRYRDAMRLGTQT